MFRKSLATIALLFASSASAADLDTEFDAYLKGEKDMTSEVFDQMWSRFSTGYGLESPNSAAHEVTRKNNFANTIEAIIEHNS